MKNKILKNKSTYLLLFWILTITFISFYLISTGYDYYWHIKAGEYMLENHTILNHDVFSWFAMSHHLPWMAHEWLTEIFLYVLKLLFGKHHVLIYCGSLFFIILSILFFANKNKFLKHLHFSFLYLFFSLPLLAVTILPRPHLFGYLFFVLTIYFLFDLRNNEESKKIYFLPLITIIWANVHGGSSNLSYILCFVFFFIGNFHFSLGKIEAKPFTKKQQKKYLLTMLLCILAIMINPFGIDLLWYPYQNMQDSFMLKTIAEWMPSNANELSHLSIFGFLGMILWILFTSDKKIKFIDLVLCAMFSFLALKSIRFWPYIYLITGFFYRRLYKRISCFSANRNIIADFYCGYFYYFYSKTKYIQQNYETGSR